MMNARVVGIAIAGALIGYGVVPFFSGGFILVSVGLVLAFACQFGLPRRKAALIRLAGVVAGLAGTIVFVSRIGY